MKLFEESCVVDKIPFPPLKWDIILKMTKIGGSQIRSGTT